jgi:hypothetical protein
MEQAKCADWNLNASDPWHDPDLEDVAKAVCAQCPVQNECLDYAVRDGLWGGVMGGMTVQERSKWAKQNGYARHGTLTGYTKDRCRCGLCQTAIREYDQGKRPRKGVCGTAAGAKRHRRAGQHPCEACLVAERSYRRLKQREYRAA